jgi:hypothetical protein
MITLFIVGSLIGLTIGCIYVNNHDVFKKKIYKKKYIELTNMNISQKDIHVLQIEPEPEDNYQFEDEWTPLNKV